MQNSTFSKMRTCFTVLLCCLWGSSVWAGSTPSWLGEVKQQQTASLGDELQQIPALVVGTSQPLEILMPVLGNEPLKEVGYFKNTPSWLSIALIEDGWAVRIWGTPPSNSWGTYTPSFIVKDQNNNLIGYELSIRVGNCKNQLWYVDNDGDGYGTDESQLTACWQPEGYVQQGSDCNDSDHTINPGAAEVEGDGVDNNCDGTGGSLPFALQPIPAIVVGAGQALEVFMPVAEGHVLAEASITANKPSWLNAAKTADGSAVRIWGTPPSNGWGTYTPTITAKSTTGETATQQLSIRVGNCKNQVWYADADGDGYGADESQLSACWQPTGYVKQGGDCNDADPTVNPASGQENCDTEENEAPVITIQGYDPNKKYYAAGQEYVFTVQVTDPNAGDHLALKAEFTNYYEPGELTFSPSTIIRGTGTLEMEVRWAPNTERPEYLAIDFIANDAAGATTKTSLFADPYIPTEIYVPAEPIVIGIDQHFLFTLDASWDTEEVPYAFFHAPDWAADDYYHNEALALGSGERYPGQADVGTYRIPVGVSYPWGTTMDTVTVIVSADCTNQRWRTDADGDGYGSSSMWSRSQLTCSSWPGMAPSTSDCNDQDASINPAAEEIPGDGIDNNCNGETDEGYGVSFAYYHGSWSVLPDFSTLEPVKTGNVENFTLKPGTREDNFGFVFSGFIKIATAGTYTFYTKSDDGSKLYINGQQVVDNDGLHGFRERSGSVYLTAGQHPIEVHYFERTGWYSQNLEVRWAGPGIAKEQIPSAVLTPATMHTNMAPIADAGDTKTVHESAGSVTLINRSSDPDGYIAAYHWKAISAPMLTMADPTAQHLVLTNLRPGDYFFELTVTDNWGVSSTDRVILYVTGDGSSARVTSAGEEEAVAGLSEQLTFYPNPVQDKLTIETGMLQQVSLEVVIYDLRGSLVYKGSHQANPADGTLELDLYELKQGIYMLRLQTPEQQRTIKIIKE